MEQLDLFHKMQCPIDIVSHPAYRRWVYEKAVELSVQCGRGPELADVRFEDESAATTGHDIKDDGTEIRCRKCRYVELLSNLDLMATSQSNLRCSFPLSFVVMIVKSSLLCLS